MTPDPAEQPASRVSVVVVRGGGDLGSGVVVALRRAGWRVVVQDLPRPTALRLTVAFASAALSGRVQVGEFTGVHAPTLDAVHQSLQCGNVPVWTGDLAELLAQLRPHALVDARLRGLSDADLTPAVAPVVVALGPGWRAGEHCTYVIETQRGPDLGRVLDHGTAQLHTGIPGDVQGLTNERLLRSPTAGVLRRHKEIGDLVEAGDVVATVDGQPVVAAISGMIRGLRLDGLWTEQGRKVGDVDPRRDRTLLDVPSDKAERVGAGVVEALRRAPADPSDRHTAKP
ncbi:MAG: selenium-dependent molybdenum cofactor biosynthesis protein YqeB [Myxococcota bacterium]